MIWLQIKHDWVVKRIPLLDDVWADFIVFHHFDAPQFLITRSVSPKDKSIVGWKGLNNEWDTLGLPCQCSQHYKYAKCKTITSCSSHFFMWNGGGTEIDFSYLTVQCLALSEMYIAIFWPLAVRFQNIYFKHCFSSLYPGVPACNCTNLPMCRTNTYRQIKIWKNKLQ